MTECPKCGKLFGVIDEQRRHVPGCNGEPETQKEPQGKCRSCGKMTEDRGLWTTRMDGVNRIEVYDFICFECQNDVGGA